MGGRMTPSAAGPMCVSRSERAIRAVSASGSGRLAGRLDDHEAGVMVNGFRSGESRTQGEKEMILGGPSALESRRARVPRAPAGSPAAAFVIESLQPLDRPLTRSA